MLLLKIIIIESVIYILFFMVFGLARVKSNAMSPNVNGGDLALFFHLDKNYETDDIATYVDEGKRYFSRVIAKAGDLVDVREGQIYVNNYPIDSTKIFTGDVTKETVIRFPYRVANGEVFLLNDNRDEGHDSRQLGSRKVEFLDGKVISIIRTRGL